MLQLLRVIAVAAVIIVVLNNGTIMRSESSPFCGYSSNTMTSTCPGDRDGVQISHPFWIENRIYDSCISYPGFQVKCAANGRPVLNISNNPYYVLSTDSHRDGGGYLRVVDVDIDAQECPQPRRSFSFDSAPFLGYYTSRTVDITIFYNCSRYAQNAVQHMPCLDNYNTNITGNRSFAFSDEDISSHRFDWYGNCEDAVVMPSSDYYGSGLTNRDYTQGLKSGFDLQWSYPVNCGNCELSGGKCWANEINKTTTPFHCNCTNYAPRVNDICPGSYYDSYSGIGGDWLNQ